MIKDVLVHLDGSPEDECRLAYAAMVASLSDGHLSGLYVNVLPDWMIAMPIDGGGAAAEVLADVSEMARDEGDAVSGRLAARLAMLGTSNELRRFDLRPGEITDRVVTETRCSDLFVATRPYGGIDNRLASNVVEGVLLASGHGLLLIPPGRRPYRPMQTIVVAWQDTREAARAVSASLGLLRQATRTVAVVVDSDRQQGGVPMPATGITKYLRRHGIVAEARELASNGRAVSDVLLDEARRVSADLVVMGGYGHSRMREWVLGGTTVEMLTRSEAPILMAH